MSAERPREAVEVVHDDDRLALAALQVSQQRLDAGALSRLAGEVIAKNLDDLIAHAIRIFAAGGFLAAEAIAAHLLLRVGHTAIDDGFLSGVACHVSVGPSGLESPSTP